MRITSSSFQISAPDFESCPEPTCPEFAFIGRSNVGKSSLLNMLSGKKGLAKISGSPGHTRLLNFFLMNNRWRLVDLPGYGYAKTSKKDRESFQEMITQYLANRPTLSCTFVLIDSMIPPQTLDLEFVRWLMEGGIPFVLVFTKLDRLKASRADKNIDLFTEKMTAWGDGIPRIFKTSAKTQLGRREMLEFVDQALKAG
jgi:GTP-binding protein